MTGEAQPGTADMAQPIGSLRRHWLQGAGVGVLLQGTGLVLAFASSIVIARLLGPHGLGQYSFVLAIVAVLSVLATFGMPTTVARMLAIYQSRNDWNHARGILRWSNTAIAASGLVLGLGLAAGGFYLAGAGLYWLYALAAPLVAVLALANLRQRALQGFHHPIVAQLPELLIKHTVFLLACASLWLAGNELISQPRGIMAAWLLAGMASLVIGMLLLNRFSPVALHSAKSGYDSGEWLSIAWPIFMADALTVVLGNTDTIILGWLRPLDEVGIYQVSLRLSVLMLVLLGASNWVLAPWFAKLHAANELERLQRLVSKTTRAIFAATLAIYLVAIFWGKPLLALCFGEKFVSSYPILLILGAGQLVNTACGPVVNLLAMTGGQRELVWSTAVTVLMNIILCLILVPSMAIIGAAISVALSTTVYNVMLAFITRKRCGIAATVLG